MPRLTSGATAGYRARARRFGGLALLAGSFAALACSGCALFGASPPPSTISCDAAGVGMSAMSAVEAEPRLYQIYIDSEGRLVDPVTRRPISDKMIEGPAGRSAVEGEESRYVSRIIENYERHPGYELIVFVHGGLTSFDESGARFSRFKSEMLCEQKYPLFISWDSKWGPNYADHLFFVRRGVQNKALGVLSSPVVLIEDLARSIVRLPVSTYNVIFGHRFQGREERAVEEATQALASGKRILLHLPPNEKHETPRIATWSNPLWWNPSKLVVAPFIDGFGTGAWGSMLRRTDLVLRKRRDDDYYQGRIPGTAVSRFFEAWEERFGNGPIDERASVTLIGHSLGTMIANEIVAEYPEINFSSIVYMAAALRVRDIATVIEPYLLRNPSAEFFNLSLSPTREISESQFLDFVPRGSLLIWIDQTFADIHSFRDRTAGYWRNIVRSAPDMFIEDGFASRVHLTMFGTHGPGPKKHGDFEEYRFWRKGYWIQEECTLISDDAYRNCLGNSPATGPAEGNPTN